MGDLVTFDGGASGSAVFVRGEEVLSVFDWELKDPESHVYLVRCQHVGEVETQPRKIAWEATVGELLALWYRGLRTEGDPLRIVAEDVYVFSAKSRAAALNVARRTAAMLAPLQRAARAEIEYIAANEWRANLWKMRRNADRALVKSVSKSRSAHILRGASTIARIAVEHVADAVNIAAAVIGYFDREGMNEWQTKSGLPSPKPRSTKPRKSSGTSGGRARKSRSGSS